MIFGQNLSSSQTKKCWSGWTVCKDPKYLDVWLFSKYIWTFVCGNPFQARQYFWKVSEPVSEKVTNFILIFSAVSQNYYNIQAKLEISSIHLGHPKSGMSIIGNGGYVVCKQPRDCPKLLLSISRLAINLFLQTIQKTAVGIFSSAWLWPTSGILAMGCGRVFEACKTLSHKLTLTCNSLS